MLLQCCKGKLGDRRVVLGDAGIGNDKVEVGDVVVGPQRFDGLGGVGLGGALDLHDDEGAGRPFGKVGERFGRGMVRVAHGGDDGDVRPCEPGRDKTSANAYLLGGQEGGSSGPRRNGLAPIGPGDKVGGV